MSNASGLRPVEYKVLVLPDVVEEKTDAGIIIPEQVRDKERWALNKGTLVAAGGLAFDYWVKFDPSGKPTNLDTIPRIGCRVAFAKYSGQVMQGADGKEYRLCNDKDIAAVIEE